MKCDYFYKNMQNFDWLLGLQRKPTVRAQCDAVSDAELKLNPS